MSVVFEVCDVLIVVTLVVGATFVHPRLDICVTYGCNKGIQISRMHKQ